MKNPMLFISCLMLAITACKKAKQTSPDKYSKHLPALNRTWIGMGYGKVTPMSGDVFSSFSVTVLNDSEIVTSLHYDTLTYTSSDFTTITFNYYLSRPSFSYEQSQLIFNYAKNTVMYSYGASGSYYYVGLDIETAPYVISPLLKNYIAEITGVKKLSGLVRDTTLNNYPAPTDTTYAVSDSITISLADELTLHYDNDILMVGDHELHYKGLDKTAHTITFETYHTAYYNHSSFAKLTYNYINKTIVFEQVNPVTYRYLKLQ